VNNAQRAAEHSQNKGLPWAALTSGDAQLIKQPGSLNVCSGKERGAPHQSTKIQFTN